MKLIIAGSRKFLDYSLLRKEVDSFLQAQAPLEVVIISGGARGADTLGEKYSIEVLKKKPLRFPVTPEEWRRLGRKAGPMRNAEMAKAGTHLIAFWNGVKHRSGTYDMIRTAQKNRLTVKVVKFGENCQPELF